MFTVVLGAGESGVGAAILARREGHKVLVSDAGVLRPEAERDFAERGIEWEAGGHTLERILRADQVVKSPGIPDTAPVVRALAERGVPVIDEIELAGRYTSAPMVCITGSNGKTTTTRLIHHLLQRAGMDYGLAGNVGHSLARQVAEAPRPGYVVELSSFQLDHMYDFRAHVAVLLNITPDHLDRYNFEMQRYVEAKMRILQNQQAADAFVYWTGDDYVTHELPRWVGPQQLLPFADHPEPGAAAWAQDGSVCWERPQALTQSQDELSLPGVHNRRNCMAAALAALAAGAPVEAVRQGLADFPGVEHRLEFVAEVDGVRYVNDSKATNVDACRWALEAQTTPVVLILGGTDKGNDYASIRPLVAERCRALVYLGADNAKLHAAFDSLGLPVADTHAMEPCVEACAALAHEGDTVLLSPCCASFDLFHGMADRGRQFKAAVRARQR